MIYPGIAELTAKILERKKVVYLCTNGMFIRKKIKEFRPSNKFFFNVHLDGMRKRTTTCRRTRGCFDAAIDGIEAAKEAGFMVCTNTTVFKETDMSELDEMFGMLTKMGVDGFMISPATATRPSTRKRFSCRGKDIREKFRAADAMVPEIQVATSPIFLEFLQGKREDVPARLGQPYAKHQGLERPMLPDHRHSPRHFDDLLNKTPWEKYGYGKDPRCENCMVHSAMKRPRRFGVNGQLGDTLKMLKWQFV